jgi:hypothetical protein
MNGAATGKSAMQKAVRSNCRYAVRSRAVSAIWITAAAALCACGGGGGGGGSSPAGANPAPASYTIGGAISGLTDQGLVLINGTDTDTPNPGDLSFTFPTSVAAGTDYAVTVQIQPTTQTCSVANGTGKVGTAAVTDISVTCAANAFSIGGTISGLTGAGLVLANGTDTVSPAAGAATFTFSTHVPSATSFNVTVMTQPSGQNCAVSNGTGVVLTSSVDNIAVACQ